MEYIDQYPIINHIKKTSKNTWDIVISRPEFSTRHVYGVKFFLTKNIPNNFTTDIMDYLDGYKYQVYRSCSQIYTGILQSNKQIFSTKDIPFGYLMYHNIMFVIKNIDLEMFEKIKYHTINFTYGESNLWVQPPPNHVSIGLGCQINWNT
jgi:hypothetical protein